MCDCKACMCVCAFFVDLDASVLKSARQKSAATLITLKKETLTHRGTGSCSSVRIQCIRGRTLPQY